MAVKLRVYLFGGPNDGQHHMIDNSAPGEWKIPMVESIREWDDSTLFGDTHRTKVAIYCRTGVVMPDGSTCYEFKRIEKW